MTLTGHHDAVTCLNLAFDSRKVISGSLDHNLKFWDLLNGKVSTKSSDTNLLIENQTHLPLDYFAFIKLLYFSF